VVLERESEGGAARLLPTEELSVVSGLPIVRRSDVLADGRALIYYDDAGSTLPAERQPDDRVLPAWPSAPEPELRLDPLTGEWVTIAAARQDRSFLPPADRDPLAPASAGNPSEIPDHYDVAVFENRYPAFGPGGRCEVVSFDPDPNGSLSTLPTRRVRTVIEAWADRTAVLSRVPGVAQVFPFENRGEQIGVTLHHPHGQVYAYPYVTPRTARLLAAVDAYGPGFFADRLQAERGGPRLVADGAHWSVFVPFAARWPIEVHVLAHRQVPDLAATTEAERDELAMLYPRLLRAVDALYDSPTAYVAAWHQAPAHGPHREHVRLMAQITSPRRGAERWKFLAGSEAAMGAFIGDIRPEDSARLLREAWARVGPG
jgi:UDPglucose--hexose-1-phosphate uridylyltransferase